MNDKSVLKSLSELISAIPAKNDDRLRDVPLATPDDADGDGIPDQWERLYGLNPYDATDAKGDPDGDGITNLDEFRNGTDPLKPNGVERAASSVTEREGKAPAHPKTHEHNPRDEPIGG